jgi:endogenous inhibitor of DNA gyrase (YacG/DUF329 family)
MIKEYCYKCGRELSKSPHDTSSHRTDGYCSARCKRKDRHRDMRAIERSIEKDAQARREDEERCERDRGQEVKGKAFGMVHK